MGIFFFHYNIYYCIFCQKLSILNYTEKKNGFTFISSQKTVDSVTFNDFMNPVRQILPDTPALESKGDRPLHFLFEDEPNSLIYYHLFGNESGRELLQKLREDDFAKEHIAPERGVSRSSFFEAVNTVGVLNSCSMFFRNSASFPAVSYPVSIPVWEILFLLTAV